MEFKDYYKILGVARDASADEIKRARRKLARKYHPDVSKESDAAERMKEINEANEVLGDPEKRAAYDQIGQQWSGGQEFRPPPGWDAGFEFSGGPDMGAGADFSEFFESLFGGLRGQRTGRTHAQAHGFAARGEDHHAKILIDLEDAFHGGRRQISLRAPETDAGGHVRLKERVLEISIPKGVREGQMIRLAGQGHPGMGGLQAGDLYLEVHFRPHPLYRIDGRDLYLTLPVAPWEAALGETVRVPTPEGAVEMRIPPGSANGRKLRLKGRGLPGKPPGDLYAMLDVVLPDAGSARAQDIYRTMARELAFNPRAALGV
jgi:curved DNA-binding protein